MIVTEEKDLVGDQEMVGDEMEETDALAVAAPRIIVVVVIEGIAAEAGADHTTEKEVGGAGQGLGVVAEVGIVGEIAIATVEIAETGTIVTEAQVILVTEKRKGQISLLLVGAIAQWTRMRRIPKRGTVKIQQAKAGEAEVGIVAVADGSGAKAVEGGKKRGEEAVDLDLVKLRRG